MEIRKFGTLTYERMNNETNIISPREEQVLNLIAEEFTNSEIAEKLKVKESTIITHRRNLCFKLGAKNTAGLMVKAFEHGLLFSNKTD